MSIDWQSALPGRIPFWKMSGCGNDFIVIDNRAQIIPAQTASAFTQAVCRRRVSIGADGVVLIQQPRAGGDIDFEWRYINADGADGEFCGNGAVCGARFAVLNGIAPARHVFSTASGPVHAEVAPPPHDERVTIAVPDPGPLQRDLTIDVFGAPRTFHAITVGVPHAVMLVEDADAAFSAADFIVFGRAVRRHPAFAPAGVNVNVVSLRPDGAIRMRTYERGVEDETLACGSGSIASAIALSALGLTAPPARVITSSGRPLYPDFAWNGTAARDVRLGGEARVVSTGEIRPDALLVE